LIFFGITEISSKYLWILSDVGLEGNEIADNLAKMGTMLRIKEMPPHADTLKKLLNGKIATEYIQEADDLAATKKWREIHKSWAEYKGKPSLHCATSRKVAGLIPDGVIGVFSLT
jgi:hypothetical protein